GGNANDSGRSNVQGPRYFVYNLIPGEHLVGGDVKGLAEGRWLTDQSRQPDSKVAGCGQSPAALSIVGNINRFALFQPGRKGVAGAGEWIGDPPFRVGVRGADDRDRKLIVPPARQQPFFVLQLLAGVLPVNVAERGVFSNGQPEQR